MSQSEACNQHECEQWSGCVTDCVSNNAQPKTELLLIKLELQIKNSSDIIENM